MKRLWPIVRAVLFYGVGGWITISLIIFLGYSVVRLLGFTSDASNAPAHRDPDDIPYPPARALSKYLHEGWELKTIVVDPATEPKNGGFPYAALRSAVLQKNGDILICEISFVSSTDGFKTDWCLPLK